MFHCKLLVLISVISYFMLSLVTLCATLDFIPCTTYQEWEWQSPECTGRKKSFFHFQFSNLRLQKKMRLAWWRNENNIISVSVNAQNSYDCFTCFFQRVFE